MKNLFTLGLALVLSLAANAQVDVETSETLPYSFDESWSGSFLINKTGVSANDKFIFTSEPITAKAWAYGAQILPKTNAAGWANLGSALDAKTAGDVTFTLTDAYAKDINDNGGLRVQGIDVKITAVKYQAATPVDPTAEVTYNLDIANMDQDWNGTTHTADGLITFTSQWGGSGWWIKDKIDMTQYKSAVFELAEAASADLLPQLAAKDADGVDANASTTLTAGKTITAVDFNPKAVTYTTIMIQNFVAGGTCQLKKVYLSSFDAATALGKADNPTGIGNVTASKQTVNANSAIYNIAGQKVNNDYKGVVIQNGKKFVQK
nr:hypothetical protein [Prevotella sp.]